MRRVLNLEPNSKIYRRNNYILFIFIGVIGTSLQRFSTFNFQLSIRLRRNNFILFIFIGVICHVSTKIFNFQLSIFNSIETHQLHRVYFYRCNVSRLYKDFQLSIFNFQFSIRLGRSGSAVGLSAISFSAALQKDAAPIPNAERQIRHQTIFRILENPVMSKTDFTSVLRFRIANCPAQAANNL